MTGKTEYVQGIGLVGDFIDLGEPQLCVLGQHLFEEPEKVKIMVVGAGAEYEKSSHAIAKFVLEMKDKNIQVSIANASKDDVRNLKMVANDSIIPIPNIIPQTYQFYPLSEVPKPRRERRADERKAKKKWK